MGRLDWSCNFTIKHTKWHCFQFSLKVTHAGQKNQNQLFFSLYNMNIAGTQSTVSQHTLLLAHVLKNGVMWILYLLAQKHLSLGWPSTTFIRRNSNCFFVAKFWTVSSFLSEGNWAESGARGHCLSQVDEQYVWRSVRFNSTEHHWSNLCGSEIRAKIAKASAP